MIFQCVFLSFPTLLRAIDKKGMTLVFGERIVLNEIRHSFFNTLFRKIFLRITAISSTL